MCIRRLSRQIYLFNLIIIILIMNGFFFITAHAQIQSDFIISDQGIHSHIKIDNNGYIHSTWDSFNGVYYCLLDSLGQAVKDTISFDKSDIAPRLSFTPQFVILVWNLRSPTFNSYIYGQLLTIHGEPIGVPFKINDSYGDAYRWSPDASFLNDTTFIVVWSGDGPYTPDTGVYGQIITTSFQFIGGNFLLSDHGFENVIHYLPRVMSHSENDDFVVLWIDDYFGEINIFGRLFYGDGTPKGPSFIINNDPELTSLLYWDTAMDTSGNFVVVFSGELNSKWQVHWRWFDNDGSPFEPAEPVTSEEDSVDRYACVDVAIDQEGRSVVAWEQMDNGHAKIYAQRFLPDRTPLGDNFKVSVVVDTFDQIYPSIALYNEKIHTAWSQVRYMDDQFVIWANILDFNDPFTSVSEELVDEPLGFSLYQNYPNPFNPKTTIIYFTKEKAHVYLAIYNILGGLIVTLEDKEVMPGVHEISWNGKNAQGGDVPQGIYLIRLNIGDVVKTRKMLLVR